MGDRLFADGLRFHRDGRVRSTKNAFCGDLQVARDGGLEPSESLDDAGFVAKVTPGEGEKIVVGPAGMEGALALDFLGENAGFEGGDARVVEVGEVEEMLFS